MFGIKRVCLLLKLILYNSFEIINGFNRLFNQRTRFQTQFHAITSLYEDFSNSQQARAGWVKITSCKNVIWCDQEGGVNWVFVAMGLGGGVTVICVPP